MLDEKISNVIKLILKEAEKKSQKKTYIIEFGQIEIKYEYHLN
ncbi:MAG: hypothetical protein VW378_01195 [bacterium]